MIGTIRWNLIIGAITFVLTFLFSFSHNIWLTTFLNSFYAFLAAFLLTFAFRFMLGSFLTLGSKSEESTEDPAESLNDKHKGTRIDAVTPDDDVPNPSFASTNEDEEGLSFVPLSPKRLVTKKDIESEQAAGAVRKMSDEEGW